MLEDIVFVWEINEGPGDHEVSKKAGSVSKNYQQCSISSFQKRKRQCT